MLVLVLLKRKTIKISTKVINMTERDFCDVLRNLVEDDTNYDIRYQLILKAIGLAHNHGYDVGFRVDPENLWPIVVIHLPTGQVSWHCPPDDVPYDGHTTQEKFDRINDYVFSVPPFHSL